MLADLIMNVTNHSSLARGVVFKWTFESLAALSRNDEAWTLMNYGYAELGERPETIRLDSRDEDERYCYQLYHHVAAGLDLHGKDVVEVSCGRGGGASYIKRYLGAKSVTGVDLATNQVAFCRRVHRAPGLRFVRGAAENIPLPDQCADAVINIEASCLYRDPYKFFKEVHRLLRPGGWFAYADIHRASDYVDLEADLEDSGLKRVAVADITENVIRALALDHDRRLNGLRQKAPFFLHGLLKSFAGTAGTRIPNGLADGSLIYLSFVLTKPAACASRFSNIATQTLQREPVAA